METTTTWLDVIFVVFVALACIWFGLILGRAIERAGRASAWAEQYVAEQAAKDRHARQLADVAALAEPEHEAYRRGTPLSAQSDPEREAGR